MAKPPHVHIYPVPGHWLPGAPATETDVDPETAADLVRSGAFTTDPPPDAAPQPDGQADAEPSDPEV